MSTFASTNFIASFDTLVKKGYQGSMVLRDSVTVRNTTGLTHRFPKIDKGIATPRLPQTDVTPMNVEHGNATATLSDWTAADYSDVFDLSKLNFDEVRELAETAKLAMGRRLDQLILNAMGASASATQVDENTGGTNSGFNIEKLLRAKRLMDDKGVPQTDRYIAIAPRAIEQALGEVEFASRDYNMLAPLASGELKSYAGFTFKLIEERDEGGLVVTTNVRNNFAYHKASVGLAIGKDITSHSDWIPEKTSTLINVLFSAGAVTIDTDGVYDLLTYEA